jgi:hypothetical protein
MLLSARNNSSAPSSKNYHPNDDADDLNVLITDDLRNVAQYLVHLTYTGVIFSKVNEIQIGREVMKFPIILVKICHANVFITTSHDESMSDGRSEISIHLYSKSFVDIVKFLDMAKEYAKMTYKEPMIFVFSVISKLLASTTYVIPIADAFHEPTIDFDLYNDNSKRIYEKICKFNDDWRLDRKNRLCKLGFLLHGPPGTGKTSFIKAITLATKRHMLCVKADAIKDSEMFGRFILFQMYQRTGVRFQDLILVIEEANTCSALWDPKIVEKRMIDFASCNVHDSKNTNTNSAVINHGKILDVFDGIIEMPGIIIIFTANDISCFHESLIRVGRIQGDEETFIGPISALQVSKYYQKVTKRPLTRDALNLLLESGLTFTKADVHNMFDSSDSEQALMRYVTMRKNRAEMIHTKVNG